jgi:hypothetical protein
MMDNAVTWQDGLDNYKNHHVCYGKNQLQYRCHLQDRSVDVNKDFYSLVNDICQSKNFRYVELLYSGGLDSELVLVALQALKIPVTAVTMRLCHLGYPVNTHDLYYSEKFCRVNNIKQRFVDLNFVDFFENQLYEKYLCPYWISEPHVATHFWLLEQCEHFPVLAGEYSWPWAHEPLLSPHRLEFSCFDRFIKDNNINGMGNFLNYSYQLNYYLIENHLNIMKSQNFKTDWKHIPIFKQNLYSKLANWNFERRKRSYGFENLPKGLYDRDQYRNQLLTKYAEVRSEISWDDQIGKLVGGGSNSNDRFF